MRNWLVAGFTAFALLVAGCGDDEDGGDLAAYCDLTASFDDQESFPSDDQLDEVEDVAPEEIRDDVETFADAIREVDEDDPAAASALFDDEEVVTALGNIEQFEAENCDTDSDDGTGDDDTDDDDSDDTTSTTSTGGGDDDGGDDGGDDTTTTSEDTTTTTSG